MRHHEASLQTACIRWFRLRYPGHLIAAIPNGGSRNKVEAANLKRQGVLAGMPDLFIPGASRDGDTIHYGLFVELKAGNNKPTERQRDVMHLLTAMGYHCLVINNIEDFVRQVNEYKNNTI